MGVIIWRTQHKNMKGIKAIYIILISWTVDCYPLAESVGLSHGSTGPSHHRSQGAVAASAPAVHHASHGAVAQPAAAHHASHGISSGYGYSGGLSSGYDSGYSSGGYGVVIAVVVMDMMNMRSQIHSSLNMVFMMIIIIQTSVNTDLEMKYTGEARHPESYGGYQDSGYHAEHGAVAQP